MKKREEVDPRLLEQVPADLTEPKAQAQYFLDLLNALAQVGSSEANAIRMNIMEAIAAFDAAEDKEQAVEELRRRFVGLEVAIAALHLRTTRKVRSDLVEQSRKLGTATPAAKQVRATAEGMDLVVNALETMLQGAEQNDDALRQKARDLFEEAQKKIDAIATGR